MAGATASRAGDAESASDAALQAPPRVVSLLGQKAEPGERPPSRRRERAGRIRCAALTRPSATSSRRARTSIPTGRGRCARRSRATSCATSRPRWCCCRSDAAASASLHRLRAHPPRFRARSQPRGRAPGADQPSRVRARGGARRRAHRAARVRAARGARARSAVAARGVRRDRVDRAIAGVVRSSRQRENRRRSTPSSGARRASAPARRSSARPSSKRWGPRSCARRRSWLGASRSGTTGPTSAFAPTTNRRNAFATSPPPRRARSSPIWPRPRAA